MQPNKSKIALLIGASYLGAFGASNAVADTFNMKVNTISDVTIATYNGNDLDFGELVKTGTGSCVMEGKYPANADVNIIHSTLPTAPNLAAQSVLTGTSCVGSGTSKGTVGIYSITGSPGLSVNLTISEVAQSSTAYTFKPNAGCYTAFDGTNTSDLDTCTAYTMGSTISGVKLPVDDATETAGATGIVTAGEIYFTVGGTIAIAAAGLSPNTTYDAEFQVDVTY